MHFRKFLRDFEKSYFGAFPVNQIHISTVCELVCGTLVCAMFVLCMGVNLSFSIKWKEFLLILSYLKMVEK